jgi:hypothetical protein
VFEQTEAEMHEWTHDGVEGGHCLKKPSIDPK